MTRNLLVPLKALQLMQVNYTRKRTLIGHEKRHDWEGNGSVIGIGMHG